ncbi:MAG: hypothetical protein EXR95_09480 [Gemmatimonadetes bacterium]|nr:hypothetical protein [Gemmatimonadota bacterium]
MTSAGVVGAKPARREPPSHRAYLKRQLFGLTVALGLLGLSLAIGMWGFRRFEHMPWRDAFVNAAMLLGGEGPMQQDLSESGKVFAGVYALYAGLAVIAIAGILLGPGIHHLMRRAHLDE